jgi:hypothetical protein
VAEAGGTVTRVAVGVNPPGVAVGMQETSPMVRSSSQRRKMIRFSIEKFLPDSIIGMNLLVFARNFAPPPANMRLQYF